LFYRSEDLGIHRFFAGSGQVNVEQVERVAEALQSHDGPIDPRELRDEADLSDTKLMTAINRLEEAGAVELLPTGEVTQSEDCPDLEEAVDTAVHAQEAHHEFVRSQIEMMRGYAEVWDCRREYLLNYFGQEFNDPCGYCDNCDAGVTVPENEQDEPYPLNTRVTHAAFGEGLVQRYEGDKVIVLFDDAGYKTLLTEFVVESGALQPIE
jgi:ATP-dependent DNA helicase RecQ